MTDEAIKAALREAGKSVCPTAQAPDGPCDPPCGLCRRQAAAAIKAFLRALPNLRVCGRNVCYLQDIAYSPAMLIEAVERAAQEGGR